MLQTISALCKSWPVTVTQQVSSDNVLIVQDDGGFVVTRAEYLDNVYKERLNTLLPMLCNEGPW